MAGLKPPVQEEGPGGKQRLLTPLLPPVILIALHWLFANSNSLPPGLHREGLSPSLVCYFKLTDIGKVRAWSAPCAPRKSLNGRSRAGRSDQRAREPADLGHVSPASSSFHKGQWAWQRVGIPATFSIPAPICFSVLTQCPPWERSPHSPVKPCVPFSGKILWAGWFSRMSFGDARVRGAGAASCGHGSCSRSLCKASPRHQTGGNSRKRDASIQLSRWIPPSPSAEGYGQPRPRGKGARGWLCTHRELHCEAGLSAPARAGDRPRIPLSPEGSWEGKKGFPAELRPQSLPKGQKVQEDGEASMLFVHSVTLCRSTREHLQSSPIPPVAPEQTPTESPEIPPRPSPIHPFPEQSPAAGPRRAAPLYYLPGLPLPGSPISQMLP